MIKTFRGILADGEQDIIRLSTKKGKIGYKIVKFEVFPNSPGAEQQESTVSIWKVPQASVSTSVALVDFSDGNLLACAHYQDSASVGEPNGPLIIMFEQEVFNQDVYITHNEVAGTQKINYYLELETMNLSDNAAVVSTLRDIRLNPQVGA